MCKTAINAKNMPITNILLNKLSSESYMHITSIGETVSLTFGEILYESGVSIDYVYFPNDALISFLTILDDDRVLEVGLIGREGMVGFALALGVNTSPMRVIVQGGGSALRLSAEFFYKELENNNLLRKQILLYIDALIAQIAQTAACNRFHVIEARLARLLLMTRDEAGASHFFLTHEFLSSILGVRREGVTKAANSLKKQKLIEYSRGNIILTNPTGLALIACSCYESLKDLQN